MKEPSEDSAPRPLPRAWLPDPHPPRGASVWDARTQRIMAAADPELRRLGKGRAAAEATSTWSSVMGRSWKPVAALAAAAVALFLLTTRPPASREPPQSSLTLSLVATEGDPVTLWSAFGIPADPVLALIAFRGQGHAAGQGTPNPRQEEMR